MEATSMEAEMSDARGAMPGSPLPMGDLAADARPGASADAPEPIDWPRVRHLYRIGIFAALLVLVGDMVLGWGTVDEGLEGLPRYLSRYLTVSDARAIASAALGLIGIPVECLSFFGVLRVIASRSAGLAHAYRAGLIGMLAFGALVHVMCCATVVHLNAVAALAPAAAADVTARFALGLLVPPTLLFFAFFVLMALVQVRAFATGATPYPRWCWVFSVPFGLLAVALTRPFGNVAAANALGTGWISLGSIWMLAGLLVLSGHAEAADYHTLKSGYSGNA